MPRLLSYLTFTVFLLFNSVNAQNSTESKIIEDPGLLSTKIQKTIALINSAKKDHDILEMAYLAIQLSYLENLSNEPLGEFTSEMAIKDAEALLKNMEPTDKNIFLANALLSARIQIGSREQIKEAIRIEQTILEEEDESLGGYGSTTLNKNQAKDVIKLFWSLPSNFQVTTEDQQMAHRLLVEALQASCGVGYFGAVYNSYMGGVFRTVGNLKLDTFVRTLAKNVQKSLGGCGDTALLRQTAINGVGYKWAPSWRVRKQTGEW